MIAGWIRPGGVRGVLGLLGLALFLPGCVGDSGPSVPAVVPVEEVQFAPELGVDLSVMEERASGLWLLQEEDGEGPEAEVESVLLMDYEGWLPNGILFDTSLESEPLQLILAQQPVIPGFAEGILGMRPGGQRLLLIPPTLGYGAQSVPTPRTTIPANSWLVFRVYMLSVETP